MTDSATRAAKWFLGAASVAGTLGGWAALASESTRLPSEAPTPATRTAPAQAAPVATADPAGVRAVGPTRRVRPRPITRTRSSR
ncbi:MAG: hypothetical protein U0263_20185 [Polyangiaceae bacterium]